MQGRSRWFGYVMNLPTDTSGCICKTMVREKSHGRKLSQKYLLMLGTETDLAKDMAQWKKKIHIGDSY